jgi:hypothetical protein
MGVACDAGNWTQSERFSSMPTRYCEAVEQFLCPTAVVVQEQGC